MRLQYERMKAERQTENQEIVLAFEKKRRAKLLFFEKKVRAKPQVGTQNAPLSVSLSETVQDTSTARKKMYI